MRKYSVVQLLTRECTKQYEIPGTNVILETGTSIVIPVFSLHRDEKYFANPMKFDPSRFFPENKSGKSIVDMPYLPFEGPRNCIAMRMGKMSTKVGVASLLHKYNVETGHQHNGDELTFSSTQNVLTPIIGIHLKFRVRNRI